LKIGVLTRVLQDRPFEKALDEIVNYGIEAIEVPCANYVGTDHADPTVLLKDKAKLNQFRKAIEDRNLTVSALSCHGNPLHPSKAISKAHVEGQHKTIMLAEELGVEIVTLMSGCPGDSDSAKYPNWVTWGMMDDCKPLIEWQWKEKVIPFWQSEVDFAEKHGIHKLALEMHSGFVVFNPQSLVRLRKAVGKTVGANFDPSHLIWQGIDTVEALRSLGDAVFHFHAKDNYLDNRNIRVNGVFPSVLDLDPKTLPWYYRTVGYGHDELYWKSVVSTLRLIGYDFVMSIEQEDVFMSRDEGLRKAVEFLKQVIMAEKPSEQYW
jgi:sugar phosphate isomerase/epimerase